MAAVEKAKQQRLLRAIEELLKHPENRHCCDCGEENPRFCSITLGSFICTRCAGIHRKIGIHVSRVKSVSHDQFTTEQVDLLKQWGNKKVQHKYRYKAPARPDLTTDAAVTAWIQAQYERKQWLRPVGAKDDDVPAASAAETEPAPAQTGGNFNAGFSSFPAAPTSPGRQPAHPHHPAPAAGAAPHAAAAAPAAPVASSDPMADLLFGGGGGAPHPGAAPVAAHPGAPAPSASAALAAQPKPAGKDDIMALYANQPRPAPSGPNYNVNVHGHPAAPMAYPPPGQIVMTPQGPMMLQPQPNGTMVMIPVAAPGMAPMPMAAPGGAYMAPTGAPAMVPGGYAAPPPAMGGFGAAPASPVAAAPKASNLGHRFDFGAPAGGSASASSAGSLL